MDQNERLFYPHKIIKTETLLNPFNDIVPRIKRSKSSNSIRVFFIGNVIAFFR